MAAEAKKELIQAVKDLDEPAAEFFLSLVHWLRARQAEPTGKESRELAHTLLLAMILGQVGTQTDWPELKSRMERLEQLAWLRISEPAFARDWDRPEEDEAWASL